VQETNKKEEDKGMFQERRVVKNKKLFKSLKRRGFIS
jgi:hypothetical protein